MLNFSFLPSPLTSKSSFSNFISGENGGSSNTFSCFFVFFFVDRVFGVFILVFFALSVSLMTLFVLNVIVTSSKFRIDRSGELMSSWSSSIASRTSWTLEISVRSFDSSSLTDSSLALCRLLRRDECAAVALMMCDFVSFLFVTFGF